MKRLEYKRFFALIISMLFLCSLCAAVFAEETSAGTEDGAAPERTDIELTDLEQVVRHRLWGFFCGWAEGETDRLEALCAEEWKKENGDPVQALQEILKDGAPHGYKPVGFSGKDGDPFLTVSVIMQRESDSGYVYSRHEIVYRREPDGYYAIDPGGIRSGEPAEAVPEQELTLLTPEGIIRSCIELHQEEGLYDRLIPVNAAVEKQGIRVELISGLVQGEKTWFMISVQDTEGKYGGYDLEPTFNDNAGSYTSGGWGELYHDRAENKSTYLYYLQLSRPPQPEDGLLTVGVNHIRLNETKRTDLVPLLKQYGRTEEGVTPPTLERRIYEGSPAVPDDVKILDETEPLDIPLFKGVCLTGIGWIGNQLHVQYRNKGPESVPMRDGSTGACWIWTDAYVYGRSYNEIDVDYSPLRWDMDDDGWTDRDEFIASIVPEDTDRLTLAAEITVTESVLDEGWYVQIPLNTVSRE